MSMSRQIVTEANKYFVFGSNLSGRHGAGAARVARERYGAKHGVGEGITGKTYALPTVGYNLSHMKLDMIKYYVERFLEYARTHKNKEFYVTRVGCGLAGYKDSDIAPMFYDAPENCIFDTVWAPFLKPDAPFWGTY